MNRYNTYFYLLFVLLIMGAFASMAQNDYGIKILGGVSLIFGILFGVQLISFFIQKERGNMTDALELLSLVLLSVILSMRVFYIRFPFVEIIFGLAGLTLIGVYLFKIFNAYKQFYSKSTRMAWLVLAFYGSIVLYTASMTIVPFIPSMAEPAGGAAFALLVGFALMGMVNRDIMIEGEKISVFEFIKRFKDRSVVLITIFLLFTAYMGFTKIGVLPKMYSDEFPQAYYELVKEAESGKAQPVNGKYKHEEFKRMYDLFIDRHSDSSKK